MEWVISDIHHNANSEHDEDHRADIDSHNKEKLKGQAIVICSPKVSGNFDVDILIICFPEESPVLKSAQQRGNRFFKVNF